MLSQLARPTCLLLCRVRSLTVKRNLWCYRQLWLSVGRHSVCTGWTTAGWGWREAGHWENTNYGLGTGWALWNIYLEIVWDFVDFDCEYTVGFKRGIKTINYTKLHYMNLLLGQGRTIGPNRCCLSILWSFKKGESLKVSFSTTMGKGSSNTNFVRLGQGYAEAKPKTITNFTL